MLGGGRRRAGGRLLRREAFGARERTRLDAPGGRVGHAELEIGDAAVMLADPWPGGQFEAPRGGAASVSTHLRVADADAAFARALAAGATAPRPVETHFYGDRGGTLRDPFGHHWHVAQRVEAPLEGAERRMAAQGGSGRGGGREPSGSRRTGRLSRGDDGPRTGGCPAMNVVRPTRTEDVAVRFEEPTLLRITSAQFSVMVEAGAFTGDRGVELRGGLLYEMTPQHVPHLRAKSELHEALLDALRALGSPLRVASEGFVLLGEGEVPQPDLIVWEPVQVRGPVPGERVRLLVEVSDTTLADDLGRKRAMYAAASVPEYWVADVPGRALHQFWAPSGGAYTLSAVAPFGEAVRSATLDGLVVTTAALDRG